MFNEEPLSARNATRADYPLAWIAVLFLVFLASCHRSETPPSEPTPADSTSPTPVEEVRTFQATSLNAANPLTITYRVTGAAFNAPFRWSLTVTDSKGSSLFQVEHDDRDRDEFFGDDGYMSGCKGYEECKSKWYFSELPRAAAEALRVVDHLSEVVQTWQRDALVHQATEFLKRKPMSEDRRDVVIHEMQLLISGRFDRLYMPANPLTEESSFMYVPSLGYFVPYWHP
jgi:hypothetical protein